MAKATGSQIKANSNYVEPMWGTLQVSTRCTDLAQITTQYNFCPDHLATRLRQHDAQMKMR